MKIAHGFGHIDHTGVVYNTRSDMHGLFLIGYPGRIPSCIVGSTRCRAKMVHNLAVEKVIVPLTIHAIALEVDVLVEAHVIHSSDFTAGAVCIHGQCYGATNCLAGFGACDATGRMSLRGRIVINTKVDAVDQILWPVPGMLCVNLHPKAVVCPLL